MAKPKTLRLSVRIYVENKLKSIEQLEVEEKELKVLLPQLATKHANEIAGKPGMIELEFLDEPDINQRFFRIGSDPRRMVTPRAFDPTRI